MKKNSFELYYLDSQFNNNKVIDIKDINYLQQIGKGQLAKVYKIELKNDNKNYYALKVICLQQLLDLDIFEYLQQEIQILQNCSHKNIIKLYTAFQQDDFIYMIMEYAEDGNLFQKLKQKKKFTEQETVKYMKDIIEALVYLHSKNPPILHRDIKPENILICKDNLKIADFGWSNFKTDIRNTYCGTADYLSPEMILGTNHNEKTDIWSLGVLLYELLHGKPCFQPKNLPLNNRAAKKLIEKNILKGKVKMNKNFSLEAKTAISLMLNPDSKQRPFAKDLLKLKFFDNSNKNQQIQQQNQDDEYSINQQLQNALKIEKSKVQNLTISLHEKEKLLNIKEKQNNELQKQIDQMNKNFESMIEEFKKISVSTKESERRKSQNRQQNLDNQIFSLQKELSLQKQTNLIMFEKSYQICNLVDKLHSQRKKQEINNIDRDQQSLQFEETIKKLNLMIDQENQQRSNSCRNINLKFQNKGYTFQKIQFKEKIEVPQFQEFYGFQKQRSFSKLNHELSYPRNKFNFQINQQYIQLKFLFYILNV